MSPRWPAGGQTVRVNWSVRKSAKTVAEQAGKGEGFSSSSYVSNAIEQRAAEWSEALEYLLDEGWTKRGLREALGTITQPPAFPRRPARTVNVALDTQVGETVARALLVLAREWAAANAELARRLS